MKKRPELLVYFLEDILEGDVSYTAKSMFWWYGIYKYWKIFAIYTDDRIYFKVGEKNRLDYETMGSNPFRYKKKWGEIWVMSYYEIPEEVLENREIIVQWIDKSLQVETKKWYQKKK